MPMLAAVDRHHLHPLAIELDGAGVRSDEPGDRAEQRRLAGAGGAEQAENSPSANVRLTSSSAASVP